MASKDPFAPGNEQMEQVTWDSPVPAEARFSFESTPPTTTTPASTFFDDAFTPTTSSAETPFHIHHTDVPSFQPVITVESGGRAPASFTPFSTSNTTDAFEFGIPITINPTTTKGFANSSTTNSQSTNFDEPTFNPFALETPLQLSPKQTAASSSTSNMATNTASKNTTGKPDAVQLGRAPSKTIVHRGLPPGVDGLLKAVKLKNIPAVRDFLAQGINPNAQNEENQTPLHLVVINPCKEIVRLLLDSPVCDPNILDIAFNTPLHIASYHCDPRSKCGPDLSELVPDKIADAATLVPKGMKEDTVGQNDTELEQIAKMLCEDQRTDVNIRNASLHVPLIYACLSGCYKLASWLVKAGASVNAATHTDTYPLHAACENGFADIVRLLVLNGALVNVRDYQGYTPLHLAARGNFGAICGFLWRHRADMNALTPPSPSDPVGKRPCDLTKDIEIRHFLSGMKTSSSHPLEINFVTNEILGKCRIGMTMCPGRSKKDHRRNLQMDIASLLQVGTQVLVSLVQQPELDMMQIPDMMSRVRSAGIEVIHAPIKDKWIPNRMGVLVELVDIILERVKQGKCITVHCNGGKGRTGLVVVATLVALGMEPGPSTDIVRAARPGMLYNPAQILYVKAYKRTVRNRAAQPQTITSRELTTMVPSEFGTTIFPPISSQAATSSNLKQIQKDANAQEKAEQPNLPSHGESSPFSDPSQDLFSTASSSNHRDSTSSNSSSSFDDPIPTRSGDLLGESFI